MWPGEGIWNNFKKLYNSLSINVEASGSIGLQANIKLGVANLDLNAYSVKIAKANIEQGGEGKMKTAGQLMFYQLRMMM